MRVCVQDYFILHLFITDEKIYPPNVTSFNVYLSINYKLLKITTFPFKSTVFTFPIPTI